LWVAAAELKETASKTNDAFFIAINADSNVKREEPGPKRYPLKVGHQSLRFVRVVCGIADALEWQPAKRRTARAQPCVFVARWLLDSMPPW